jgi:hypothetical protein
MPIGESTVVVLNLSTDAVESILTRHYHLNDDPTNGQDTERLVLNAILSLLVKHGYLDFNEGFDIWLGGPKPTPEVVFP